jgi:hypothetical protein
MPLTPFERVHHPICDRAQANRQAFRKLLEAEQEALPADAQRRAALNNDNYDFTMLTYVVSENPVAPARMIY